MLPVLRRRFVVLGEAAAVRHQQALISRRAQARVDQIADALGRARLQGPDELLRQADETGLGAQQGVVVGSLQIVEKDDVEIAAVGHLAAGELAHADDEKLALVQPVEALGGAPPLLTPCQLEAFLDAELGDLGQRALRVGATDLVVHVEQADVDQLAVVEEAQRVEAELWLVAPALVLEEAVHRAVTRGELLARQQQQVGVVEERLDQTWVGGDVLGEIFGAGEQRGQARHQFGSVDEQLVEERALADAMQEAVEIVHGALGRGAVLDVAREMFRQTLGESAGRRVGEQEGNVAREEIEDLLAGALLE